MPDGAVHAIGPDGKHYQFPAGYTPDQVQMYFKSPEQRAAAVAARPPTSDEGTPPSNNPLGFMKDYLSSPEGPSLGDVARTLGFPGSKEEASAGAEYYQQHPIKAALQNVLRAVNPLSSPGGSTLESMGRQEFRALKDPTDPMAGVRAVSGLNPFAAPVTESMEQFRERGQPGAATAAGIEGILGLVAGGGKASEVPEPAIVRQQRSQLRQMTKQQIVEQAHAKLNSQVEPTNQLIRDVPLANMRKEVGQHVQGLDAGDVAASPDGRPQVNTTRLHPLLDDITNSHRSVVGSSRFAQATDEVSNLPANAYWKDVHDAKMNVRSLWAKSAEGSPEKSALNKLSTGLEDILGDRAKEINQVPQYNKYRELTKAYHAYESSDNVIGKMLDTPLGKDYFKLLRDPAYADQLSAASKDFAKYGLPEDTLSNLAKNNAQLHDFVTVQKGAGFRGKIRAITDEPIPALAGMFGGQAIGTLLGHPTLGGLIGAMKAADLAETAGARRVLAQQGLAPSRELIGAPVEPAPGGPGAAAARRDPGTAPTAAGPAVADSDVKDLTSMLLDQFPKMDKKAAATQARAALEQNSGDVDKAIGQLVRQKGLATKVAETREKQPPPVSGGKTESTPTAEGRAAQAEAARQGAKYLKPSEKGKGTAKTPIEETEEGRRLIAERIKRGKK